EANDPPDLVLIHTALDGRHEDHIAGDLSQPVERQQLFGQEVRLTAYGLVRLSVKAVKLQVDRGTEHGEFAEQRVVTRDAPTVRVDHDVPDAALLGGAQHGGDLRVDRGLAARELHHLRLALGFDEVVKDALDFGQAQGEAGAGVRKAEWTGHVAGAVD